MGKNVTGDKPKFDLITASKTKKYKIIFGIILGLGVLLLIGGIVLRGTLTSAVTPNSLTIEHLSNLDGAAPINYKCIISQDESFVLSTSTPQDRALINPITFDLDDDAKMFAEIREKTNTTAITQDRYQGMFWIHIRDDAPRFIGTEQTDANRPKGYLTIRCGSRVLRIELTYYAK